MANEKKDEASSRSQEQVPASYAEKAMSSLLRLHDDLVEEKEKRIDLYRRLMDREQELAEVRSYVQLLESELARRGALPPGASGFLPAPGSAEEEQRRLQPGVSAAEGAGERGGPWPTPRTSPLGEDAQTQPAPSPRTSTPSSPSQATEEPAQGPGASEAAPAARPASSRPAPTSRPSQGSPAPTSEPERPSEPPTGRAPVIAWIPFNSSGRGGGGR